MADLIGDRQTRSPSEVIFKTLAITTTTGIAAGHLTTLRRISRKDSADAILTVLGTLLLPALPLASIIRNSWSAFRFLYNREQFDPMFFLSAALGVRATEIGTDEDARLSIPLLRADYARLLRHRKRYDSRWVGRMMVLLLFAAQAVMTVVLARRRIQYEGGSAFTSWDVYNSRIALGGIITAVSSICLAVLNTSWHIDVVPHADNKPKTYSRVLVALLDVGTASEAAVELRTARILGLLISATLLPEQRSWIGAIVLSFRNSLGSAPLTLAPDYQFAPVPWHQGASNPALFLVLKTALGGVLVTPVILLLAHSIRWISRIWRSVYLRKGSNIGLAIIRVLLNLFIVTIHIFCISMMIEDIKTLKYRRESGQWLDIMWVDPWSESLYAI